ncbi:MAG: hypothetical protein IPP78_15915 [Holophagaceae bacterium]|nr:hypothetical protein [Holophagaceae bacterium]
MDAADAPLCALLSLPQSLFAQTPPPRQTREIYSGKAQYTAASATTPVAKVIAEIRDHQQAVSNLQYLCDEIGPRLTGSERLVKAHEWMEGRMKAYGLANVHREAYDFGPSWPEALRPHGSSGTTT